MQQSQYYLQTTPRQAEHTDAIALASLLHICTAADLPLPALRLQPAHCICFPPTALQCLCCTVTASRRLKAAVLLLLLYIPWRAPPSCPSQLQAAPHALHPAQQHHHVDSHLQDNTQPCQHRYHQHAGSRTAVPTVRLPKPSLQQLMRWLLSQCALGTYSC